jgi:hypothetical protein
MTFLEAAIEVLKREGKPLQTKRLAELAVKLNLLSVVGRDPEGTMGERLEAHLEKDAHRSEIIQLGPGLFGLRVYPPRPYPPVAPKEAAPAAEGNGESGGAAAAPASGEQREGGAAATGERKRRRRRRRGRGGREGAVATDAVAAEGEADGDEGEEGAEPAQGELPLGAPSRAEPPSGTEAAGAAGAPPAEAAEGAEPEGAEPEGVDEGEAGAAEGAPASAEGNGERRGRRRSRRGGRGRRRGDRPAAAAPTEAAGAGAEPPTLVDVTSPGEGAAPTAEGEADRAASAALASAADEVAGEEPPVEEPAVAEPGAEESEADIAEPGAAGEELAAEGAEGTEGEEDEELLDEDEGPYDDELELPSGPLLAPTAGTEEATRSDEDRAVMRATPGFRVGDDRVHHYGGRRDRDRRRRGDRDRGGERGRDQHRERERGAQAHGGQPHGGQPRPSGPPPSAKPAVPPQASAAAPSGAAPAGAPAATPAPADPTGVATTGGQLAQVTLPRPGGPRLTPMLEAVVEALRGAEGRPMHVSAIAEEVVRRKLVDDKGGASEIARQVRAALIRDERERHVEGLRHRFLNLGGGLFALAEKRLEPELLPLERELADRAGRVRDATRAAIRRRLLRLAPAAFEALGRALLDKMGVERVELVRRAEGVAYYGGVRSTGVGQTKVLVAMRAGEQEINRRAVGELRAGLQIRGFDEGLLFAAGRPAPDGTAELKLSPGVTAYDGQSLAGLMMKHGLGVRRLSLPVDYLDLELFHELTEAAAGDGGGASGTTPQNT